MLAVVEMGSVGRGDSRLFQCFSLRFSYVRHFSFKKKENPASFYHQKLVGFEIVYTDALGIWGEGRSLCSIFHQRLNDQNTQNAVTVQQNKSGFF